MSRKSHFQPSFIIYVSAKNVFNDAHYYFTFPFRSVSEDFAVNIVRNLNNMSNARNKIADTFDKVR